MKKSPKRSKRTKGRVGFTLVELLTVMAIIAVLAGLVLSTAGYVQQKAARSRAEAEIKAMEAALENYKGDNGDYPRTATGTGLGINTATAVTAASNAQRVLYQALTGDGNSALVAGGAASTGKIGVNGKAYFEPRKEMLSGTGATTILADPWGAAYNYAIADPGGTNAFNPGAFDLWSLGGATISSGTAGRPKWIKNW